MAAAIVPDINPAPQTAFPDYPILYGISTKIPAVINSHREAIWIQKLGQLHKGVSFNRVAFNQGALFYNVAVASIDETCF